MENNAASQTVYGVFATGSYFYARPELIKLFVSEADSEAYAELLRGVVEDALWAGAPPEPAFSAVKVVPLSVVPKTR